MFSRVFLLASVALLALSPISAHPFHATWKEVRMVGLTQSAKRAAHAAELDLLGEGNKKFRENIQASDPGLLKQLTDEGQAPPFMFIGCSDSRVSEGTVFNAKPGTFFTERNIANQFFATDANAHSVMSYGISELGVKHIIVMGHYGCGGVAAAIASAPSAPIDAANGAVQNWIDPIRAIFQTSTRPEIVELREKNKLLAKVEEPEPQEPGFRALVEENVKASVHRIATDSVIANHFAALAGNTTETLLKRAEGEPAGDVFIHGWVYDIENGEIRDLGISVGPPGKEIPAAPFAAVESAAAQTEQKAEAPKVLAEESPKARCESLCKAKRSLFGRSAM
ncbi:Carbonic anhydrase 2 [Hypsizygus marmoreus]|uniref:Carbonic anhydrase n=1 Tax=Hypsizygus marmoreus TaxID=39966 RepID=A0A369K5R8_HYPMA|nr:Carbonic anhydrase 2 [Hypsizygus marmoreus]